MDGAHLHETISANRVFDGWEHDLQNQWVPGRDLTVCCCRQKERSLTTRMTGSMPLESAQEHKYARHQKGCYPKRVDVQPGSA